MGMGEIIIQKRRASGKPWVNTYCFKTSDSAGLTDADLEAIGAGVALTDANTDTTDSGYDNATAPLIHALVAFERQFHYNPISITGVYVSDGFKNSEVTDIGPLASAFASMPANLSCEHVPDGGESAVAPGNVALLVHRVPAGFSTRPGSLWYRGVLGDTNVKLDGERLIAWTSDSDRAAIETFMQGLLTSAGVNRFFSTGSDTIQLGIPQRVKGVVIPPVDVGDLIGVRPITGFQVDKPASRQTTKGRKRSV